MGSKFARGAPVARRGEKERLLLVAAAGLAASLVIIMIVVLNYKREAIASQAVSPAQPVVAVPMGTVTLFVPDREVGMGTKLSEVSFKEVYWPRNQVPPNAVLDLSELKNQYAKSNLPAGLPVQRQSLTTTAGRAGLAVTAGNRAVTIEVDRAQSIEGYTTPGSVVDVVLTFHEEGNLTSKVIVEGARVLSLAGDATQEAVKAPQRNGTHNQGTTTITLDVTTQEALKIQTARQMGRLSLMLRNDVDHKAADTLVVTADDFSARDKRKIEKPTVCTRGTMKMGDVSYIVNCDGSMVKLNAGDQ